jgi:hypothetical protein
MIRELLPRQTICLPLVTLTSAIHPGEVNQLAVRGEGSHFEFFINGEFVGEADDSEFSSGIAGLVLGFLNVGDKGVFEFDNFSFGKGGQR